MPRSITVTTQARIGNDAGIAMKVANDAHDVDLNIFDAGNGSELALRFEIDALRELVRVGTETLRRITESIEQQRTQNVSDR